MKVRLTHLSGKVRLRTATVEGHAENPPMAGHRFNLLAIPLDPTADYRLVQTSPVVDPSMSGGRFSTESGSIYRIEILTQETN